MVLGQAIVQDKQGYRHLIETGQIRTLTTQEVVHVLDFVSYFRSAIFCNSARFLHATRLPKRSHQSDLQLFPKADGTQHLTLDWICSTNHCTIIDILGKNIQSWLEWTCMESFQSCHTGTKWCSIIFGTSLWNTLNAFLSALHFEVAK